MKKLFSYTKKLELAFFQKLSKPLVKKTIVVYSSLPFFMLLCFGYYHMWGSILNHFNLHPVEEFINFREHQTGTLEGLLNHCTLVFIIAGIGILGIILGLYISLVGLYLNSVTDETKINKLIDSVEKINAFNDLSAMKNKFNNISKKNSNLIKLL